MKKCPRIMVVDDNPEMLRIVSRILELEGYSVAAASSGSRALALLDEQEPDLVILDIMMPGLSGFQIVDLIRQRGSIPVIILATGYEVTTLDGAPGLGADDYVRKPFRKAELLVRVKEKLRRAKSRKLSL